VRPSFVKKTFLSLKGNPMKKTSIILAALLIAAGALQADTITYTNTMTMANDTDNVITLSKFDLSLGTLTGIYLEYKTRISGASVEMDNDAAVAQTGTARILNTVDHFAVSVNALDENANAIAEWYNFQVNTNKSFSLAATGADPVGFTATGGADYAIWAPGVATAKKGGNIGSLYFGEYTGAGSFDATIHCLFTTTATFNGTDGYFQGNTPNGAFDAKVVYTYSPIPEPASASMAVLVLVAGFWVRRRFLA
jgi:hypothetical protein